MGMHGIPMRPVQQIMKIYNAETMRMSMRFAKQSGQKHVLSVLGRKQLLQLDVYCKINT